ncbi:MAG: sensor histidine kinase [Actinomycetota bacterium]
MKTLRGRLMTATLILATVGLIAADGATFGLLRSSLYSRIDHTLEQIGQREGILSRIITGDLRGPFIGPGPGRGVGSEFDSAYVMLLGSDGSVLYERDLGFGGTAVRPILPSLLPGNASYKGKNELIIFSSRAVSGDVPYRVFARVVSVDIQGTQLVGTAVFALPLASTLVTLRKLVLVEMLVTVAVIGGVAALAYWLIGIGLRPLTQMETAASEIAEGTLSKRVDPSDEESEIGRLGLALNTMLERIEASFSAKERSEARLRRFVADASHELRTPLTSIRGYAELFRHGASSRPEDIGKSMRRIEDESARMSVLVDELLLLARLDQGRPLEKAPVELNAILQDAVTDARAVDPERPIDLQTNGSVVVPGDEARLRQVVANLLSNALHHTPERTPVHVKLHSDDQNATVEVIDEGAGLDADVASKVFDRFYRVEESRARDNGLSGGTGLGLSIVAAIVQSHGGSVSVQTAPGEGARFIVTLPSSSS